MNGLAKLVLVAVGIFLINLFADTPQESGIDFTGTTEYENTTSGLEETQLEESQDDVPTYREDRDEVKGLYESYFGTEDGVEDEDEIEYGRRVPLPTRTQPSRDDRRLRYNYMEDEWDYADSDDSLKYNYMDDAWDFAGDDDDLKYNYMDDYWEYTNERDRLKYDYMDDEWGFVGEGDRLKYNYMEDTWEYTDPGSNLRYNYMEDEWGY